MRLWDLFRRYFAPERPAEVLDLSGAGGDPPPAAPEAVAPLTLVRPRLLRAALNHDGSETPILLEKYRHTIVVTGYPRAFHHTGTKPDGTWIYSPLT